ncbi:hypothetical protein BH23ACT7_BH23ACT7_22440 [soil metagenome]
MRPIRRVGPAYPGLMESPRNFGGRAGGAGRAVTRLLDELVLRARVPAADVVAEAVKRGLPLSGSTASEALASLRWCAPAALDPLARSYVSSNALAAGAQGFVANLGGAITMPVSIPADTVGMLAWMVRATSGVMGAYGFETETEHGAAQLRVGLLVASGVSKLTLEGTQVLVAHLSRQLLDRAAAERLNAYLTGQVTRRVGGGLVRGRLPRAVPVVGGAIGAGVNLTMVRAMGGRARAHYRGLLEEWQRNQGLRPPVVWDVG